MNTETPDKFDFAYYSGCELVEIAQNKGVLPYEVFETEFDGRACVTVKMPLKAKEQGQEEEYYRTTCLQFIGIDDYTDSETEPQPNLMIAMLNKETMDWEFRFTKCTENYYSLICEAVSDSYERGNPLAGVNGLVKLANKFFQGNV